MAGKDGQNGTPGINTQLVNGTEGTLLIPPWIARRESPASLHIRGLHPTESGDNHSATIAALVYLYHLGLVAFKSDTHIAIFIWDFPCQKQRAGLTQNASA